MSDDVSQFLQQVEELKGRRLEEDEARTRDLEEKILQDKRERQARRAGTFRVLLSFPFPSSVQSDSVTTRREARKRVCY